MMGYMPLWSFPMPSKTKKQARFMQIAAHDPEFAKKAGVPVNVAREYAAVDERKKGYASERRKGKATPRIATPTR